LIVAVLRIAISQPVNSADPRSNGRVVRALMERAAAQEARLVQFPEGMLSGYAKEQIASWDDVDWTVVADEVDQVAALAGELGIWVVLGCAHPLTPPNRPHNSLYVISDDGTIIDRYDKRLCSHTEITHYYSPGFRPIVFDVDGLRFGCAICIEVNFPDLFAEYELLGVDCVLLSAYPVDSIFAIKARSHAAINNYWIGLSAPAQTRELFPSALIGPDGEHVARVRPDDDLIVADIDPADPAFHVALDLARPWRRRAQSGEIYAERRVTDPRSIDRTSR